MAETRFKDNTPLKLWHLAVFCWLQNFWLAVNPFLFNHHWLGKPTLSFFTISALTKMDVIDKAPISVVKSVGEHFHCPPFVLDDMWLTASFLLPSTSSFLPSPLPPCPEGVNCRVGRAQVQAPGWQGPPTLSFTQDRLIHVLWALWRPVCQVADC